VDNGTVTKAITDFKCTKYDQTRGSASVRNTADIGCCWGFDSSQFLHLDLAGIGDQIGDGSDGDEVFFLFLFSFTQTVLFLFKEMKGRERERTDD